MSEKIKKPLISIITVCYNSEKHLRESIDSVLNQTYDNIEYIIVDGESMDNTLDIIKEYEPKFNGRMKWISEPDNGIYDAMNKGIDMSSGDWLYFLGSDDILCHDILNKIYKYLNQEYQVVFGNIKYNTGDIVYSKLNLKTLLHNTLHHQSAFYNSSLFNNWSYRAELELISDYELNLKIYIEKLNHLKIDEIIALCNENGLSRRMIKTSIKETNIIKKKYFNWYIYFILKIIYQLKVWLKNV